MVILRGVTLRHLKILLRQGRVLAPGCASCDRLLAQLGPDAEPVPKASGQPLTDDRVHGRVDWEPPLPFAGDARDIRTETVTLDQLDGALPAVVGLCPVHAGEFYVPHGGVCPEPGCDRQLKVYEVPA